MIPRRGTNAYATAVKPDGCIQIPDSETVLRMRELEVSCFSIAATIKPTGSGHTALERNAKNLHKPLWF